MTYDEIFVAIVKAATVNEVNNKVFHLEVYQTDTSFNQSVPSCVLYHQRARPENSPEISGRSGFFIADYTLSVISKDSDMIRAAAQNLYDLGEEDPNETNYTTYSTQGYDWLDVIDDQEGVEYAAELEAKGYKIATVQALFYHREITNNARSY